VLSNFHPVIARWFFDTLGTPTAAQARGWAAIRDGRHTLIAAPTGSGKTLAAFLTAIDELFREGLEHPLPDEVRVVYVSPLKALSADIHKNLAEPRRGIERFAFEHGLAAPKLTAAVRTGDTTGSERAAMLRRPPHILVTTPESLYLLLTSARSREMLRTVRTVIVDEIHAVIGTRRGAHLALTLERLQQAVGAERFLRLGLSATQRPVEEVAQYLIGADTSRGDCVIVDEGHRREMDLAIEVPGSPIDAVMAHEVWEEYYDRLAQLIASHKTTLIFVNTRRIAERAARHLSERIGEDLVTAHHGSLSKAHRLDAEHRLKTGQLKALVATASLELGIDIGHVDLVCQIGSPHRIATLLQRFGRSGHTISGTPKGRLMPVSRDDLVECVALLRSVRRGELDRIVHQDAPLDVLAQQITAETACLEYGEDDLFQLVRRAWPYRQLDRRNFDAVVSMVAEGFATRRGRRAALVHRDEVHSTLRARRASRLLALTSGGAIPEVADYRVLLEPEDTFIGTLNEDFAIESLAGDIFQLANTSWQITRVGPGLVRVIDAHGAPPTIPFWTGEAPARSDELSRAVSDLRAGVENQPKELAADWLAREAGISAAAAGQVSEYVAAGRATLGAVPTQETLVLERFFDEAGGMQLVLHAPFGSRINRAWALALRKRFCRQFNFELQAAATDDALLLSLGPQHSFPLADVFRYLHPASVRDILIQAFLDAPVFATRWRWNATISLAVPRNRGGKKVPPQIQRMQADDLMAAAFPDAAACLENIPGDRQLPDHPLVNQTVRDCLHEAMDLDGLLGVLSRIHRGELRLLSRDTPEPSAFSHEILNAKPYQFVDDAPLEERRTMAVQTRRSSEFKSDDLCALDANAVERVRDEERPDPRDAAELHDALVCDGYLLSSEVNAEQLQSLAATSRATRVSLPSTPGVDIVVAAERLPELLAVHPSPTLTPAISAPASRRSRQWTRDNGLAELLRGRMAILGPATAKALGASIGLEASELEPALLALEADGAILRGHFTPGAESIEWCDRRLLARIHRYTLNRLRAEIAPVSAADFMRFLFAWQHVDPAHALSGVDGLRAALTQLDGIEVPAKAWEKHVLRARVDKYEPSLLDTLCLTGEVTWARLSSGPTQVVGATPIALMMREHFGVFRSLRDRTASPEQPLSESATRVLSHLGSRGASFAQELAAGIGLTDDDLKSALGELVAAGLVSSDGFAGLRAIVDPSSTPRTARTRTMSSAGRWFALGAERSDFTRDASLDVARDDPERSRRVAAETIAWTLLHRYGVVFRRLATRETTGVTWRELVRVYRRLEDRGEIRGGRFVAGMPGEQFALPDAVDRLREIRRSGQDDRIVPISAADPLNLTGIVTPGERLREAAGNRIVYLNGVPVAALEGEAIRQLADVDPSLASDVAAAAAGRRVPVLSGFVGRVS
jgi:ATP-dependent helicase Lhr and Lhr-like helicase